MDHVAIMRISWGLLPKILSGEKKIESRWYKNRAVPWGKINSGDVVYFKNTGEPVTVKTVVTKVLSFEDLDLSKIKNILDKYGTDIGIASKDSEYYLQLFKEKRYCLLIFISKPQPIKRFEINKKGFGAMAAWISVRNIRQIQILR